MPFSKELESAKYVVEQEEEHLRLNTYRCSLKSHPQDSHHRGLRVRQGVECQDARDDNNDGDADNNDDDSRRCKEGGRSSGPASLPNPAQQCQLGVDARTQPTGLD